MQSLMQRNFYKELLFLLIIIGFSISSFGQSGQTDQNWWMGNTDRGIQFSQPNDSAVLISRPAQGSYGPNGGAVASDPITGGLLFYTDGNGIYDASHAPMTGAASLGGDPNRSQPAAISSVPGEPNKYYVFTNSISGQILISEIDMTRGGTFPSPPLGEVTGTPTGFGTLNGQSEAMILIPRMSDSTFWLITHVAGTNQFNISHIGENDVLTPSPAPVTPTGGNLIPIFTASHFAYDSVSNTLIVTPSDPNKNVLLYSFDETTGTLSANANTILFGSAAAGGTPAIYDAEISPSGRYLYVSKTGTGGNGLILQFDLTDRTASPDTVVFGLTGSYGLQIGPDSAIYHIYEEDPGEFLVGRINDPDTVAAESLYEEDVFGHDFNAQQFPSFGQIFPTINVDFTSVGSCSNSPVAFFPTVTPGADSLAWDFGDGNGSSTWSPTHTYEEGNTYPVTVYAFVGGQVADSATHDINITQFDTQISLVQDTTACSCELARPKATNGGTTYPNGQACNPFRLTAQINPQDGGTIQWYGPDGLLDGQTSAEVTIDTAGFYYVVVTQGGCSTYAGVNVKEYGIIDQRANVWHFGNQAGLDFNPQPGDPPGTPSVTPITFPLVSNEGVATISDENGQVILSTNGNEVFDREGTIVGTGLGGSQNSTQSALIIPFAADPTLFYIFVTQEIFPTPGQYELRYAIFDRKRGQYGEVVPTPVGPSTVLFTRSTERITGNENWLIAHEFGTNNFIAYPITPQGIGSPVVSSVGSVHAFTPPQEGEGYMELGPGYLAVAVNDRVEIFNFDNATGIVSDPQSLPVTGGQAYGIEFSGNKLFVSTLGPPSELHEFVYDSSDQEFQHLGVIVSGTTDLGAIQTAPNGTIYVAINNSSTLGAIQVNADSTQLSTFDAAAQPLLGGTNSLLGLPNFTQNLSTAPQQPSITVMNACHLDTTFFSGTGADVIDTLVWNFGDTTVLESTVGTHEIEHLYRYPGEYTVTVQVRNRCIGLDTTLSQTVIIHENPTALSGALALCTGDEEILASNPPLDGLSFEWSTRDTTNAITPPAAGIYTVTVTSAQGCTDDGEWFVTDNRPQVDLGPDRTVCENSGNIVLDADPNASNDNTVISYQWTGAVTTTQQVVTETTQTPGTRTYLLEVNNSFTNCVARDTVTIIVNAEPQVDIIDVTNSACNVDPATGSVEFQITSTGNYSYLLTGPDGGPFSGTDVVGGGPSITATPLGAGAYNLVVSDQVSGCPNQQTIAISNEDFEADLAQIDSCNDAAGLMRARITLTGTSVPTNYRYTILDATDQSTVLAPVTASAATTTTQPFRNGTFVVQVEDIATGCIAVSNTEEIIQSDPVDVSSVLVDGCGEPITITVTAATNDGYQWTGPSIQTGLGTNEITATPSTSGTPAPYDYTVIVLGDQVNTCNDTTTVTVDPENLPVATIDETDPCEDNVIYTAQPIGNFSYVWEDDAGNPITGAGQQLFVTAADNGAQFTLRVLDNATGCELEPVEITAAVLGDLLVDIDTEPACAGTPFTLTATTPTTPDSYQWEFNNEAIAGETNRTLTVTDNKTGDYSVEVRRAAFGKECLAEDKVGIVVNPTTPGSLPDEGIICPYDENLDPRTRTVTLNAGDDFLSYQWFTVVGTAETPVADDNEDGLPQTLVADAAGTYRVRLVNFYNCPSSDNITLIEECDPQITGPNAFRPDGLNKEFGLFTFFIAEEDFQIYIFNRWGEMVYQSTARDFKWNGGYKNDLSQPVPPGTYSYVVKYKSVFRPELGVQEFRSGVVVLR